MKSTSSHKWLLKNIKNDRWLIALMSLTSGIISVSFVAFAWLSQYVINTAVDTVKGTATGNMWLYAAALIGVLLLQAALNIVQSHLQVYTRGRLSIRLKKNLFSQFFKKKWKSVSEYHSGDLLNRLTSDIQIVVQGLIGLVPRCVSLATRLVASITVLLIMDLRFTLIMLCAGGAVLIFSRIYGRRMKKLHKAVQQADGKTRSYMQEGVENWMAVQSFGGIRALKIHLAELQERHFRLSVRRNHISNFANTLVYLLFSGCYYFALIWGALRLASGGIREGDFVAFLQIIQQIQTPFRNMSGVLPEYYGMVASAERLIEIEGLPDENAVPIPDGVYGRLSEIRVENLTFAYDSDPVLMDTELVIHKGEFIALAGLSGIGKSTLLKLLLGFFQPQKGGIALRCNDGTEIPVDASTRGLFAYVPQGNMIMSGTIRQNICFFSEEPADEAIWEAAQAAELADFIKGLPAGLDTELGERGLGLSEGQSQRLAIARALLHGAPILLLDEATAALDELTESRVLDNIRRMSGKTCICVSHRPMALAVCDRVIHIKDGKFTE